MNRKELFKQLNALCEKLDYKYDINRGGCCYVAACLAEQLEKYNIPYTAIQYGLGNHFSIKVSDRYLNRCDYKKNEINNTYEPFESFKDLLHYYHHHTWNETYEPKYNGCVKKAIKAVFNKYGNNRT
jgi:hypothetical protein